tara:strand:+ start:2365 stop:2556 length:192 start_codon:yes stop_codon:yes gene_type:complete
MSRVATEDTQMISHIEYTCDSIHDFGTGLYEDLMDREHEEATKKAQELIKVLSDLIQSISDEI